MTTAAIPQAAPGDAALPLVEKRLVQWHFACGVFFLLAAVTWGFLASLQFLNHYPFDGIGFLAYGRVRMLHTNEIAYGFLVNAFLAVLYYTVPRMTGRPVANAKLGWFILVVWQLCTVLTSVGQLLGKAQGVEWGETPTGFRPGSFDLNFVPVDFLIEIGAVLVAIQFLVPIAQSIQK